MLNDTQSLILCGCIAAFIFITGVLGILDNFIVLTVLTLMIITFVFNIYLATTSQQNEEIENDESFKDLF